MLKCSYVIRSRCDSSFNPQPAFISFLFSDPQQAYLPGRGDHPVRVPDLHHRAMHRLPLLSGPGHAHGRHGGHRGGRPEWHPHQRRQASGDGPQGWPLRSWLSFEVLDGTTL